MSDARLDQLLEQYRSLDEARSRLQLELDGLKAEIQTLAVAGKPYEHDGIKLRWARALVDYKKVAQAYPPTAFPQFYTQKIEPKTVSKFLSPAELDTYRPDGYSVRISR